MDVQATVTRLLTEAFAAGVTFGPSDDPGWVERLRTEVNAQRQATLVGLALRVGAKTDPGGDFQRFRIAVEAFESRPQDERIAIVEDPIFMIWLMAVVRQASGNSSSETKLLGELADFEAQCLRALDEVAQNGDRRIAGIPVRRFDVHPLLAEVAPPTYTFPQMRPGDKAPQSTAYTIPFFVEAGSVAMNRIEERWPELAYLIPRFVRLLVHVPDADFRSASAARYTGVVFLTADDGTLFDLEESIVHEYGHQLLYRIMELDPIVAANRGEFSLPWSGATRDFYGYFHAFCIYLLLADYFSRVIAITAGVERDRAIARRNDVVTGIQDALKDFADERFTPLGRAFLALKRTEAMGISKARLVEAMS